MKPPQKRARQRTPKKSVIAPPPPKTGPSETYCSFDAIFPNLTPKDRETVFQLQSRANEIQDWFQEDPSRVGALQTNPYETLNELAHRLGITLPAAQPANLPKITVLNNPFDCVCVPPPLLNAVWEFIGQSSTNLSAWLAAPYQVIQEVATLTGASAQDEDAVTNAFEYVFGAQGALLNPQALLQNLQGVKPSLLMIRPNESGS
jgi:hypothetical protein